MTNAFYLDTASSGDMKDSGSHSRTADEMRDGMTEFVGTIWVLHYGEYAPILKNTNMYGLKPLAK